MSLTLQRRIAPARIAEWLSVDLETARAVSDLMSGRMSPFDVPAVAEWRDRCYHRPYSDKPETIMRAIDATIGTFGTEAIWGSSVTQPVAEYCNTGDTYSATVLYDYVAGRFRLTTMGDFIERFARRYQIE